MTWCELRAIWKSSYLRQRKDKAGGKRYSMHIMNDNLAVMQITVADLLKANPSTIRFFINIHTACVGCYLARFCTLQDVVDTYQIDEKYFLEELAKFTDVQNLKTE